MERFSDCMYRDICKYDEECDTACKRYKFTSFLLKHSNIPLSKQTSNILVPDEIDEDAFDILDDIRNNIDEFVEQGRKLYLFSKHCGNGKTSWAIRMLLQYFDYIWEDCSLDTRGVIISVPEYIRKSKSFNSPDAVSYINQLDNAIEKSDIVVFDDLGFADMSNWDYSTLSPKSLKSSFLSKLLVTTIALPLNSQS